MNVSFLTLLIFRSLIKIFDPCVKHRKIFLSINAICKTIADDLDHLLFQSAPSFPYLFPVLRSFVTQYGGSSVLIETGTPACKRVFKGCSSKLLAAPPTHYHMDTLQVKYHVQQDTASIADFPCPTAMINTVYMQF